MAPHRMLRAVCWTVCLCTGKGAAPQCAASDPQCAERPSGALPLGVEELARLTAARGSRFVVQVFPTHYVPTAAQAWDTLAANAPRSTVWRAQCAVAPDVCALLGVGALSGALGEEWHGQPAYVARTHGEYERYDGMKSIIMSVFEWAEAALKADAPVVRAAPPGGAQPELPPFYVYDAIDWMSMTCADGPVRSLFEGAHATRESGWRESHRWLAYTDDYWFLKHALAHPSRTLDPERASVFVYGGLLNTVMSSLKDGQITECCVGAVCGAGLIDAANEELRNSPWFLRRGGQDHVVVASHFGSWKIWHQKTADGQRALPLAFCNAITFETNVEAHDRLFLASTYVGHACPRREKTHDVSFVGSLDPETVPRPGFLQRREACAALEASALAVGVCGAGPQCPTLAQARFGLHVHGDAWGSQRLVDTLLSGTVPVVTNAAQYSILPRFLPWRDMTLFASLAGSNQTFLDALDTQAAQRYAAVLAFNERNRVTEWLDWKSPYLFVQYMAEFARFVARSRSPSAV